jgi:hypothetical protein
MTANWCGVAAWKNSINMALLSKLCAKKKRIRLDIFIVMLRVR